MNKIIKLFSLILLIASTSFAWDYLLSDGTWTRQTSPFEYKETRVYRTHEALEAKAKFDDNNHLIVYTEYDGQEYVCEDETVPIPENAPKRISILRLVLAIKNAGKLDEFMAWLDQSGFKDLFYMSQEFTTDNEYFLLGKESAKQVLGMTDEEVEAIISSAYLNSK